MTPRQKDCYDFIVAYIEEHTISPSYAEIANGIGIKSKSSVLRLLKGLKERGKISRLAHHTRAIMILPTEDIYLENERLRAALERHGKHDRACGHHDRDYCDPNPGKCTCGLDAALSVERKKTMDDLLETYIGQKIATFGFPVGMGIAPPQEAVNEMAKDIRLLVAEEQASPERDT